MGKKRTRLEIIHDILEVIKSKNGKIKPTHVLYKSNLSYQMMDEYLKELIEKSFIVEIAGKTGKSYAITEKGDKFLREYRVIADFSSAFGLE
jgi:predicted transcriptional regulator